MIKQLFKFTLLPIAAMAMVLSFSQCSTDDDSPMGQNEYEDEDDDNASLYRSYMYYNAVAYNLSAYYEYEVGDGSDSSDDEDSDIFAYNTGAYLFGKVLDEATPTEYYLSVVDLDEAKEFFTDNILSGVDIDLLEADDDGSQLLDMGDYGSVKYYESSAVDGGLATIDISVKGLNGITKFHLIDENLWSENVDESPTQGVEAGVILKSTNGTLYICTRKATGGQSGLLLNLSVVSGENSSSHKHYRKVEWAGMSGAKKMFHSYPSVSEWKDIFAVAYDGTSTYGTRANFLKYIKAVGITDSGMFDGGTYPVSSVYCGEKYYSWSSAGYYRMMSVPYTTYTFGKYSSVSTKIHSMRTDDYNESKYCYFMSFSNSSKFVNFNWVTYSASDTKFYNNYSVYYIED